MEQKIKNVKIEKIENKKKRNLEKYKKSKKINLQICKEFLR